MRGEIHYHLQADSHAPQSDVYPEQAIALLSPQIQREHAAAESSFYQSRWNSGINEGRRTVAQVLSQASVEERNPFEIGAYRGDPRLFRENRKRYSRWLGIEPLLQRKLAALSNGEQRKVFLVRTLLQSPRLLILDDPFGGLDRATRARLKSTIHRLMRGGLPILVITNRPDELPLCATHLLLVRNHRIIAQGTKRAVLKHARARELASSSFSAMSSRSSSAKYRQIGQRAAPLIELEHVTARLCGKRILNDVNWTMRRGENWALLGPNGSGKTTLLSLIQGDNPQGYAVDIKLFGTQSSSTQTLWHLRRKIGWLSPELHLHHPPEWSCLEVVCSGYFNTVGLYDACSSRQRAEARNWLDRLGLGGFEKRLFGELSLGDQRMVLLARAAVKKPKLLVLDEPCQGLDASHRLAVLDTVDRLMEQTNANLIFVTHHAKEMPACVTHVLVLRGGRVLQIKRRKGAGR